MGFCFWINNKRNLRRALYILLIGWLFRSLTLWLLFRVLRTSSQVFEGELYQLWTPNCSNPEVAHDKWINIEITSFCNTFCPTFWLLKIPTLRSSNQFLWFFFKVFFLFFVFCFVITSCLFWQVLLVIRRKIGFLKIVSLSLTVKEAKR